jgi:hypothetical protein
MTTENTDDLHSLGKEIAPIVRSAIGALNHTRIGYTSEHDAQADPYIDEILDVVRQAIKRAELEGKLAILDDLSDALDPLVVKQIRESLEAEIKTLKGGNREV